MLRADADNRRAGNAGLEQVFQKLVQRVVCVAQHEDPEIGLE
jgi:hypothetical protein